MAKQSAYLQRLNAELDATFNAGAAMAMQFAMDTLGGPVVENFRLCEVVT